MSFFVGAGIWAIVGVALALWSSNADRNWQEALTLLGVMPEGPDSPHGAARHPVLFFRRRRAYLSAGYPRAVPTNDRRVETWRLRRARRRQIFFGWMVGGLIVAVLVTAVLDAARDQALWILTLIPVAAALGFAGRFVYKYGNGVAEDTAAPDSS